MDIAALVVAIASALAAVAAVVYARRLDGTARQAVAAARESAAAAGRSAAASEKRAALDAERRHEELTPRFRLWLEPDSLDNDDRWLRLLLLGPPDLGRLDALTLRIRDDEQFSWRMELAELGQVGEGQVWGRLRFTADSQTDSAGRSTLASGMPVGDGLGFLLESTWPPSSTMSFEDWRAEAGTVVRLQVEARRKGYEPWSLACEIDLAAESASVEVP